MVKLKISVIRRALETTLTKRGLSKRQAKTLANEYLEGELQGKPSHGLIALSGLLNKPFQKPLPIKIIKQTKALVYLEAHQNHGILVAEKAVPLVIKMTQKQGVGLVLVRNMKSWLRPGLLAQKIAHKNLIAIVFNNGGPPHTAPPGGFDPLLATNPVGIGIPTQKEPILVDMATSKRAWGEVRLAKANITKLPKDSYYDQKGKITHVPEKAYSALPMGGYKGFSLSLLIEILTGSLVDMTMGVDKHKKDYQATRGAFILAVNPQESTSLSNFKQANSKLIKEIKSSKKHKGIKEIFIPGEKALKTKQQNLNKGYLTIDEKLWQQITT